MFFKKIQLANNPFCKTLTWVVKSPILLIIIAATVLGCAANLKRPSIQEQPLALGDRVRVSTSDGPSDRFVGSLVALDSDTLFLKHRSLGLRQEY